MGIIDLINELRAHLDKLGFEKGLQDPEVIELSQKLDKLINIYYKSEARNEKATG